MARKIHKLSTVEVLQKLNDGGAIEELQTAIRTVSLGVSQRGGKGSVTLKLDFTRTKGGALQVNDAVKFVEPVLLKDPTMFFALPDGELTRDNPSQPGFAMSEEEEEAVA